MKRTYECMVLLDNREVRQGWDTLKDHVAGMLTKHGAEIVSSRFWEERKLAYSIEHQERGTYLLVYFEAPTETITPINREFQMAEPVLRHVVTSCGEVPESAHAPEAEFDVSKIGMDKKPEPEAEAEATGKAEKTDKAEKAEKTEKTEKAEKTDKAADGADAPAKSEAADSNGAATAEAAALAETKTAETKTPETKEDK